MIFHTHTRKEFGEKHANTIIIQAVWSVFFLFILYSYSSLRPRKWKLSWAFSADFFLLLKTLVSVAKQRKFAKLRNLNFSASSITELFLDWIVKLRGLIVCVSFVTWSRVRFPFLEFFNLINSDSLGFVYCCFILCRKVNYTTGQSVQTGRSAK